MPSFKSEPQSPSITGPNSSSNLYSLDGQGEGPSGGQGEATSPCYLYYRLYNKGGAIESYNSIYSNDPFTSRILPKSLTPPQTVLSLKKHLCKIEGFSGSSAILFESLSSDAVLKDITHLKLPGRLGVSPGVPMALLVGVAEEVKRQARPQAVNELIENPDPLVTRYIYYRLYDEEGEVISKTAFDESDTFLGRIDTLSVAPPRTVDFIKSRIMKVEGVVDQKIQLFENTDGKVLMSDTDCAPFFAETFPGCIEDNPLAFVYVSKIPSSTSTMTKAIQAKYEFTPNSYFGWHGYRAGDILHTDGVKVTLHHRYGLNGKLKNSGTWACDKAINSVGNVAFVMAGNFTFC
jgi:hypothetical protein